MQKFYLNETENLQLIKIAESIGFQSKRETAKYVFRIGLKQALLELDQENKSINKSTGGTVCEKTDL